MGLIEVKPEIIISPQMIWWGLSGICVSVGAIVGTVTKVMTRNHITKDMAEEKYSTIKDNNNLSNKIDSLGQAWIDNLTSLLN